MKLTLSGAAVVLAGLSCASPDSSRPLDDRAANPELLGNLVYSNPYSGDAGTVPFSSNWTAYGTTKVIHADKVVLTILVQDDPDYIYFDDFGFRELVVGPNLIQNPGFETGDLSGWYLTPGTIDDGFVDEYGDDAEDGIFPHSGKYYYGNGAVGQVSGYSQTLYTTPGTSYTLSFWISGGGEDGTVAQVYLYYIEIPYNLKISPTIQGGSNTVGVVTNVQFPVLSGQAGPMQTITVIMDWNTVGTTTSDSSGHFTLQFPQASPLVPGENYIWAYASSDVDSSDWSEFLIVNYVLGIAPQA
ncbi:hypothetical protein BX600DRAFT_513265 [Xylariales sp. PMI_506]|nr:hypothetical protein BX600DRAFT_513265 [Xylariales sp. PMI_506]